MKTQFNTNIVKRYKNGESSRRISRDEGCSYNAVLRELKRKGIDTGLRFWTKNEIEKLKKLYPITSNKELSKEFPNRTRETLSSIAWRLGLKKRLCKKICRICGEKIIIKHRTKYRYGKELCLKCVKKQWEHNNLESGRKRKKLWLQKNPGYKKKYQRKYLKKYQKKRRKEDPKFRLDQNISSLIYQSLRDKKAGRKWETLVIYTLKELTEHLESQFDDKMSWENYGSYWHVDHIKPRSLFQYIFPEDQEFKECWALENLQPLEKTTNLRKNNSFISQ